MTGGLLNLVSYGNPNIILNGNPSKTFFKVVYSKYTNFGMQKFRIDYKGLRSLRHSEESQFTFKIPRYAELLMDSYIVVRIPDIWSPIHPASSSDEQFVGYDFKWIENLGIHMIKEVEVTIGGQTVQHYSGHYLQSVKNRDFSNTKKELHDKMTGNIIEFNDPANANGNVNTYPNAYYQGTMNIEPSIRGRNIYIPLDLWFSRSSKMAFPLVSLQYNELHIVVTMRPIRELFTIRDVTDKENNYPYIQPSFNVATQQMHRFLQAPPNTSLTYEDFNANWDADIHMMCTYCFLSEEEKKVFASKNQDYLIKEVHEYEFKNVTGSKKISLDSLGMVSNYMWFFQRSDVNLRNEWSNYTNWPYKSLPHKLTEAPIQPGKPGLNPDGTFTGLMITGNLHIENRKEILDNFAIVLDGKYRENLFDSGVYNYMEKYIKTEGNADDGIYCYNFCINSSNDELQPSGGINMSKFTKIEFEFNTYVPVLDPSANFTVICNEEGTPIGTNKSPWSIYDYAFDLHVFEERYNILSFTSGNAGLRFSR